MRFVNLALTPVILIIAISTSLKAGESTGNIVWQKYDDGLKLAAKNNKPILIDFYTDWCGFCKKMDKFTYADSSVIRYINSKFIPVKLNGESKEVLALPDGPSDGRNVARAFGIRGYPATWFLEANGKRINFVPGFAPPEKFIYYLKYIGDGVYKTTSFQDYIKASGASR